MRKPALVASDIDGTLLDPVQRITPRTKAIVRRIIESGTPFVLATGRPPHWFAAITAELGLTGYVVSMNGAITYHAGEDRIVNMRTIDPVVLNDVVSAVDNALPGCGYAVERASAPVRGIQDHAVANFVADENYAHPWAGAYDHVPIRPLAEVIGHPTPKLLIRHQGLNSTDMLDALEPLIGDAVTVTTPINVGYLEVSARGVTKATGLAEVADLLGIAQRDIIAFGDMPNDVAMLQWAGHGVAMASAHPAVIEAADEITASNSEDGVAQVLERWF